jgi:hypothetical protein
MDQSDFRGKPSDSTSPRCSLAEMTEKKKRERAPYKRMGGGTSNPLDAKLKFVNDGNQKISYLT